jgi:hypothetical protein
MAIFGESEKETEWVLLMDAIERWSSTDRAYQESFALLISADCTIDEGNLE